MRRIYEHTALKDNRKLTADRLEFLNLIIDHLTARGIMDPKLLYETPFTDFDTKGVKACSSTLTWFDWCKYSAKYNRNLRLDTNSAFWAMHPKGLPLWSFSDMQSCRSARSSTLTWFDWCKYSAT